MSKKKDEKKQLSTQKKRERLTVSEGNVELNNDNVSGLLDAFGVDDIDMLGVMLTQIISMTSAGGNDTKKEMLINGAIAMLSDITPKNSIEGMLAVQMVTAHFLALEVANRAMVKDQTVEGVTEGISRTNRMMKTFVSQVDAMAKLRGNTKTVTIKHVNVSEGGQAIIGDVHHGGSDDKK